MAESSTEPLLALLAVKMLGGDKVAEAHPTLKPLKKFIDAAVARGWLASEKVAAAVKTSSKKSPKTPPKLVAELSLTTEGRAFVDRAGGPEGAVAQAQYFVELRRSLDSDRKALREQVAEALKTTVRGADTGAASLAALSKAVATLADKLAKLEASTGQNSAERLFEKIDAGFSVLLRRLEQAAPIGRGVDAPTAPAPAPVGKPPTVGEALHAAYNRLILYLKYQDRIVDLPALYHEARKTAPDLTPTAMHQELMAQWEAKNLELKILNEVHKATEPDKGIWRFEKLYYYVIWDKS